MQILRLMYPKDRLYSRGKKKDRKLGRTNPSLSSFSFFLHFPLPPFRDRISLCSLLKCLKCSILPQPPECWDFRSAPSWPAPVNYFLKLRLLECKTSKMASLLHSITHTHLTWMDGWSLGLGLAQSVFSGALVM